MRFGGIFLAKRTPNLRPSNLMLKSRIRRHWRRRLVRSLSRLWLGQPRHLNAPIKSTPKSIAIIRPNHRLGNILLLTPLVAAIEKRWPEAKIDVVGGGRLDAIFQAFPSIRDCIQAPEPAIKLLWNRSFKKRLRHRHDVAINIDPQSQSAKLIAKIADAPSVVEPTSDHSAHMALAPLAALSDVLDTPLLSPWPQLSIRLSEQERREGKKSLLALLSMDDTQQPLIGLYPFANKGRDYPLTWWNEFVSSLRTTLAEARLIEILPAHGQRLLPQTDGAFLTLELRELASQLSALDAVIATDGGVMHLASASGVMTWGLFKVTKPEVYAPYGGQNRGWTENEAEPNALAAALQAVLLDRERA